MVRITTEFNSGKEVGSLGEVTSVKSKPLKTLQIRWIDGTHQWLPKTCWRKIEKIIDPGRRRLAVTQPACPSLPALPALSPCVTTSVALLVILPLLYLLYVLVVRRTRAPKRRRSSCSGLHASNPLGIYEPV